MAAEEFPELIPARMVKVVEKHSHDPQAADDVRQYALLGRMEWETPVRRKSNFAARSQRAGSFRQAARRVSPIRARIGEATLHPSIGATLRFDQPATGPIVLGRLAHFGLGRFEPVPNAKPIPTEKAVESVDRHRGLNSKTWAEPRVR
jgi:hypothetical protein